MIKGKLMSVGIFSAIAASLCCITPVLALIAGSGSLASSFSWIEPARPYLIGVTIAVLGLAWYLKLKSQPKDDCGCAVNEQPKFLQTKTFLLLVTIFAGLMIGFPSYAKVFFQKNEKKAIAIKEAKTHTAELIIRGMSCAACEERVNHAINKLPGIIESTVSYKSQNAIVKFDLFKTSLNDITDAVNGTGYKVVNFSIKK